MTFRVFVPLYFVLEIPWRGRVFWKKFTVVKRLKLLVLTSETLRSIKGQSRPIGTQEEILLFWIRDLQEKQWEGNVTGIAYRTGACREMGLHIWASVCDGDRGLDLKSMPNDADWRAKGFMASEDIWASETIDLHSAISVTPSPAVHSMEFENRIVMPAAASSVHRVFDPSVSESSRFAYSRVSTILLSNGLVSFLCKAVYPNDLYSER